MAVIVTTLFVGTVAGAVYKPLLSIDPVPVPLTDQFTRVLLRFVILAVNWTVPSTLMEPAAPNTLMAGVAAGVPEPPQELRIVTPESSARHKTKCCQRVFWTRRSILE